MRTVYARVIFFRIIFQNITIFFCNVFLEHPNIIVPSQNYEDAERLETLRSVSSICSNGNANNLVILYLHIIFIIIEINSIL